MTTNKTKPGQSPDGSAAATDNTPPLSPDVQAGGPEESSLEADFFERGLSTEHLQAEAQAADEEELSPAGTGGWNKAGLIAGGLGFAAVLAAIVWNVARPEASPGDTSPETEAPAIAETVAKTGAGQADREARSGAGQNAGESTLLAKNTASEAPFSTGDSDAGAPSEASRVVWAPSQDAAPQQLAAEVAATIAADIEAIRAPESETPPAPAAAAPPSSVGAASENPAKDSVASATPEASEAAAKAAPQASTPQNRPQTSQQADGLVHDAEKAAAAPVGAANTPALNQLAQTPQAQTESGVAPREASAAPQPDQAGQTTKPAPGSTVAAATGAASALGEKPEGPAQLTVTQPATSQAPSGTEADRGTTSAAEASAAQQAAEKQNRLKACRAAYRSYRYAATLRLCRAALTSAEIPKSDADAAAYIAHAATELGNLPTARRWARRAVRADPAIALPYMILGMDAQENGKLSEAKRNYNRYLQLAPRGRFASDLRAIVLTL